MSVFARPLEVVGHRGLGQGVRDGMFENTLESFQAAAGLGARWVEMDVRRAADGALVICHDHRLPDGTAVDTLAADDFERLGFPHFETVLAELTPDVGIDVDMKMRLDDALLSPDETTAALIARTVRAKAADRAVMLTSFSPAALLHARRVDPERPVGLLAGPETPLRELAPAARHLGAQVAAPHASTVAASPMDATTEPLSDDELRWQLDIVRRSGLQVMVWGGHHTDLPRLAALQIEAACVDDVAAAIALLQQRPETDVVDP